MGGYGSKIGFKKNGVTINLKTDTVKQIDPECEFKYFFCYSQSYMQEPGKVLAMVSVSTH